MKGKVNRMSTFMPKAETVERKWYILDAAGKPLGRVAAKAAHILRGKHKPTYAPHCDCGDHVIVINCAKAVLTGTKQIVDVAGQTNYILASKGGNIVFSKALANGENKNISMNKAYLSIPAGSPVNQFALSFGNEGETTGINAIEAGQQAAQPLPFTTSAAAASANPLRAASISVAARNSWLNN